MQLKIFGVLARQLQVRKWKTKSKASWKAFEVPLGNDCPAELLTNLGFEFMLTATGIGSGIDIGGLVSQLVAAERAPEDTRIFVREARLNAELSSLGSFQSGLSNVTGSLNTLKTQSLFQGFTSSSTDNAVVIASASSTASVSEYDISVSQLAQAHSLASQSYVTATEEVGTGTLTISFGTTDYTDPDPGPESYNSFTLNSDKGAISLELDSSNNSLEGIRDAINSRNAGVSASIVNDGSGFRLLLNSDDTGEANSLKISVTDTGDSNDTDTLGLSALAFNSAATNMQQTRVALDAQISISGLAVTSAKNQITDALEGITLTLTGISDGEPAKISVVKDTQSVTQAINGFVAGYNSFMNSVAQIAGYNPETQLGGVLQGDAAVRSITNQVRTLISKPLGEAGDTFRYLSELGIRSDSSGNLTLDSVVLNEAMEENMDAVMALFADVTTAADADISVIGVGTDTELGNYNVDITQLATQAEYLGSVIGFPLTVDAQNDNLTIAVNGVSSANLTITAGTYSDGDELAAELQSLINGDSNLFEAGHTVAVTFNASSNKLEIRAALYGSESTIEILTVDTNSLAELGLQVAAEASGLDVEGSIGGIVATGSGTVLTGADDTAAAGLILDIQGGALGARGAVSYTNGLAGQIQAQIDGYLSEGGLFDSRTDGINAQLEALEQQQEALDRRIDSFEDRYLKQFNALDGLLAKLSTTSSFLEIQLASLPGPRKLNK